LSQRPAAGQDRKRVCSDPARRRGFIASLASAV